MHKALIAFYLLFSAVFVCKTNAQTQVSPRYSVDGRVNAMTTNGDTLILGGDFSYTGLHTGGGALFTTTSDQPNLSFPKMLGTVSASTPDGSGGFYIYGNFSEESEPVNSGYKRIEHVLANRTFESNFSLSVGTLFGVQTLLYHNGLLYIGGSYVDNIGGQPVGDLCAVNVVTKQLVTWVPAVVRRYLGGVSGLHIYQNTLYINGSFDSVGAVARKNIAAIELYTGTVKAWNFASHWADYQQFSDIDFYQNRVVVSGNFSNGGAGNNQQHGCALTDTISGAAINYVFNSTSLFGTGLFNLYFGAAVNSIAVSDNRLYTFSRGTYDTRITALNLADSNRPVWGKYFYLTDNAAELKVVNGALYAAGAFTEVYQTMYNSNSPTDVPERKIRGALKLDAATGLLLNWFPQPAYWNGGGYASTMSISGNEIFIGGQFTHVNAETTPNIAMINLRTQQIVPFNLNSSGNIKALKRVGKVLYAGGNIPYINGVSVNKSLLAIDLNTDTLLNWNPLITGTVRSLEANGPYLYAGGDIAQSGNGSARHLFAINGATGSVDPWASAPDQPVNALQVFNGKLYVGGEFSNISGTGRSRLAAYDLTSLALTGWNPNANSVVNAISASGGTIWAGGSFSQMGGMNCNGFAGLSEQSGAVSHQSPLAFGGSVNAIAVKGCTVVLGGNFGIDSCNNLSLYNLSSRTFAPSTTFCQHPDGTVNSLVFADSSLYFGGNFTKTNGKANATNLERILFSSGYFAGCADWVTVAGGNWNNPAIWDKGTVPPSDARVLVKHPITVTADATCLSLQTTAGGMVHVNSGIKLNVTN